MAQVTFLGTGGGRWMVITQTRSTSGLWIEFDKTTIVVDPGPGWPLRVKQMALDPRKIDGILVTHAHIDHSDSVSVACEAMTQGGTKNRGVLIAPSDCLNDKSPVILPYLRDRIKEIHTLELATTYTIGGVEISAVHKHDHKTVETYGLFLSTPAANLALVVDGVFHEEMISSYNGVGDKDLMILHTTMAEDGYRVGHLDFQTAEYLIAGTKPNHAVLTHFGLRAHDSFPESIANEISKKTGVRVTASYDGLTLPFGKAVGRERKRLDAFLD